MRALQMHPNPEVIVASLAAQFEAPIDDVASLYESEWADLAADAQVTNYLHIFVVRHVQDILRKRTSGNRRSHGRTGPV